MVSSNVAHAAPSTAPLPPSLPASGLMGHLPEMARDPLGLLMRARAEVGDIVRVRMGPKQVIFVYHPHDIQTVLTTHAAKYGRQTRGYKLLQSLLGMGLLTSEGAHWRKQRRIAQPAFTRRVVQGFHAVFVEEAMALAESWRALAESGEAFDVVPHLNHLTLRVAARTLFGTDVDEKIVGGALTTVLDQFACQVSAAVPFPQYMPTPGNFRYHRAKRRLHRVVDSIIRRRRAENRIGEDLLGMLMAARDEDTGEGMSDAELRDEILTMLLAGHETTANTLCWTLHLLSTHPEVARRLETELGEVLVAGLPLFADLRSLPYATQVLEESMRLYPPAWMLGRTANEEDVIGGYRIPKGSFVYMSQYATHRHPDFWDNPEAFDPERFSPEAVERAKATGRPRYAYFPFGGGQRQCIGEHFARMESLAILSVLASRFRFALFPGHKVEMDPSVTLRPRHGLPMTLAALA